MKQFFLLPALLLLSGLNAHAEEAASPPEKSLFFSDQESSMIDNLVDKSRAKSQSNAGLHLGAVMYYGPQDWAIWLQGQRWTPATDRKDLHIISVEPNAVHLTWVRNVKAQPQDIILHPYQTYQIGSGKIVEGLR